MADAEAVARPRRPASLPGMTQPSPSPMSVDEFIPWAMQRPGRYELELGTVIAMSPENLGHMRAKDGACGALAAAIRTAGLACEALPDGATVRVDASTAYEPDALVYCGPRLPARTVEVPNPIVVVEVVSPSSGDRDHNQKLIGYFMVPSVQHYLIVDAERRVLVHHARGPDHIATRILHGGPLRLDPPGLDLAVEDLFGAS